MKEIFNYPLPPDDSTELKRKQEVVEQIIDQGRQTVDPEERKYLRQALASKIRAGLVDRNFLFDKLATLKTEDEVLEKWVEDPLHLKEMVDILIPGEEEIDVPLPEAETAIEPEIRELEDKFQIITVDDVLVPTRDDESGLITPGDRPLRREIIPRTEMLKQLLKANDITTEDFFIIQGKRDPKMVRRLSYEMFVIMSLEKMVLVCDESDNATFIIHKADSPEIYYRLSKEDLKENQLVESIRWSNPEDWPNEILEALTRELPQPVSERSSDRSGKKERSETYGVFVGLADAYLNELGDEEIKAAEIPAHYQRFLELNDLSAKDYSLGAFKLRAYLIRQERGMELERKKSPGAAAKVREFLDTLTDDDLRSRRAGVLYNEFLIYSTLSPEAMTFDNFCSYIYRRRTGEKAKSEQTIDLNKVAKVRSFLASLRDVELSSSDTFAIYQRLLAAYQWTDDDYKYQTFWGMLERHRERRKVATERMVRSKAIQEIHPLASAFVTSLSSEELKLSAKILYKKFLETKNLVEADYHFESFRLFVDKARRAEEMKFKRNRFTGDQVETLKIFLAGLSEEELRMPDVKLYQSFLKFMGLTEEEYAIKSMRVYIARARKQRKITNEVPKFKLAREFLARTGDKVSNSNRFDLYEDFLRSLGWTERDYGFRSFEKQVDRWLGEEKNRKL